MLMTPEQAAEKFCPFALGFATRPDAWGCKGSACALWRWERLSTDHPLWRDAVKAEAAKTDEKPPYAKAARVVADDPAAFGIVVERGYCGAGGN